MVIRPNQLKLNKETNPMATKTTTQTPAINKVEIISDIYIDTIAKFISSRKLNPFANYNKLLERPNSVRVAKLAKFLLVDETSGESVTVTSIVSTEELYSIVNKVYNHFRNLTEPQAEKQAIESGIFSQLKSEQSNA